MAQAAKKGRAHGHFVHPNTEGGHGGSSSDHLTCNRTTETHETHLESTGATCSPVLWILSGHRGLRQGRHRASQGLALLPRPSRKSADSETGVALKHVKASFTSGAGDPWSLLLHIEPADSLGISPHLRRGSSITSPQSRQTESTISQ